MWTVHVLLIPSGWPIETVHMNRYDRILNGLAQQQPRQLFKWAISRLLWLVWNNNIIILWNTILSMHSISAFIIDKHNRMRWAGFDPWCGDIQVDAMPMMIERLTVWFMCTKCILGKRRAINVADIVQLRRRHLWSLSVCTFMRILLSSKPFRWHSLIFSRIHKITLWASQKRPSPAVHACGGSGILTYCEEMCW